MKRLSDSVCKEKKGGDWLFLFGYYVYFSEFESCNMFNNLVMATVSELSPSSTSFSPLTIIFYLHTWCDEHHVMHVLFINIRNMCTFYQPWKVLVII